MKILKSILLFVSVISMVSINAQTDAEVIKTIYKQSLTNGKSYDWLNHLSNQIGSRLSGSLGAERAVAYTKEEMEKLGLDKVWLQPVMVPKWVRGAQEFAFIESTPGKTTNVNICALGGSIATPALGLKAEVVEVKNFEDLEALGPENIEGKIVFYNRPMQADLILTFEAYGGCVNQRYKGAVEAIKYGAVGVIVRSMNLRMDDLPHTGSMTYDNLPVDRRIPSAAISTNDAELLSTMLKLDNSIKFYFKQNCKQLKDVQSYNVVGEITGSEFPNEYMIVGGHLDSWDLGDGSHDDGAGVVQSMEVLHLFKRMGIRPKRTIRCVLFANEENGMYGATEYAKLAKKKGENHIAAIESDAGGHTPVGFRMDAEASIAKESYARVQKWRSIFSSLGVWDIQPGGSAADISRLKDQKTVLFGYRPDSQRYFDYHHSERDVFENVHRRELLLGGGAMAALVYLIDKYGI